MKRVEFCCIVMLILLLLAACGRENPTSQRDVACPEIRIFFAPSAPHQNITRATVTVSGPDMDTITGDLAIEGKTASGTLEVPVGTARVFTIEAYEGDIVRHRGSETIDIPAGEPVPPLDIYLEPTDLTIIIKSTAELVSEGDRFKAEVRIYNVDQLYATTFVLRYDMDLLSMLEQETRSGDLLGDDVIFFQRIDNDMINIGVTLRGDVDGVNGSGVVAVISFEALDAGTARIEFLRDQRLSLTSPDGEDVTGFDHIITIDEVVDVE